MKRFAIALLAIAILGGSATAAPMSGAIQIGGGFNTVMPMPYYLMTGYQAINFQVGGIYFPTDLLAVMADFSFGLPSKYSFEGDGDNEEMEFKSSYIDALVGLHWPINDEGFLYLAGGMSMAFGNATMTEFGPGDEVDVESGFGLAFGAGLAMPVAENILAHINVRHRFIKSTWAPSGDGAPEIKYPYSLGGLEASFGFSIGFGY